MLFSCHIIKFRHCFKFRFLITRFLRVSRHTLDDPCNGSRRFSKNLHHYMFCLEITALYSNTLQFMKAASCRLSQQGKPDHRGRSSAAPRDSDPCAISQDTSKFATSRGFESNGHSTRRLFNQRDKHADYLTVSSLHNLQGVVNYLRIFRMEIPAFFSIPTSQLLKRISGHGAEAIYKAVTSQKSISTQET